MHSRIYQISKEPIYEIDYIEESYYWDHWFVGSVADYVNGNTNRENDIKWLKDCYEKRGLSFDSDNNGEYLIVNDKAKYFAAKFEAFQKALKELSEATLDDFAAGECASIYNLDAAYCDKFGFYIEIEEDDGTIEFDSFVRLAEIGAKYYIGATIDYHW